MVDNSELDRYIEKLKKCEYIPDEKAVKRICDKCKELLSKERNVVSLSAPITVRKYYKKKLSYKKFNKKIDMW